VVEVTIRPLREADRAWLKRFVAERWGSEIVVARGRVLRPEDHPGFVAEDGGEPLGLVTYRVEDGDCEIVTIDSVVEGRGVGTALLDAVTAEARKAGCRRVWLITTNDNLNAVRFYQGRGFRLVAVHPNAVEESRRLKPQIAEVGSFGIPIRDELELELSLDA
jgi:ribosomal protein S18 acetylase RimI-like enzyme